MDPLQGICWFSGVYFWEWRQPKWIYMCPSTDIPLADMDVMAPAPGVTGR